MSVLGQGLQRAGQTEAKELINESPTDSRTFRDRKSPVPRKCACVPVAQGPCINGESRVPRVQEACPHSKRGDHLSTHRRLVKRAPPGAPKSSEMPWRIDR